MIFKIFETIKILWLIDSVRPQLFSLEVSGKKMYLSNYRLLYHTGLVVLFISVITTFSRALGQGVLGPSGGPISTSGTGEFYVSRNQVSILTGLMHWYAPRYDYIADASLKKGSEHTLVVLTGDGEVWTIHEAQSPFGPSLVKTKISSGTALTGSVDFNKIVGDALYMLTTNGVFVTRDSGASWQADSAGLNAGNILDLDLDSAQYVYAATDKGLFVQSPDSNIWRQINSSTFGFLNGFSKVFIDRKDRIFLAGNDMTAIYMSTDHSSTWSVDTAGLGGGIITFNKFGDDAFGNVYLSTTNTSPSQPKAIFKSSGGTLPWTRIDQGIAAITVNPPAINSIGGDSTLYAGTSFGLYTSTDQGTTWKESNDGIPSETFNGLVETQNGRLIVSTALAIYTKDAADTSWTKRFPVKGYEAGLPIYQDGLGNLYTVEQSQSSYGNIVKSTDNGTMWTYDTLGLSSIKGWLSYVDESGTQYIAASVNGLRGVYKFVLYQKKLGGTWSMDSTGALGYVGFINSIASDYHGYLYMSVYYSNAVGSQTQGVVRRPINSGTWALDTAGLPSGFTFFYEIQADKNGMMYGHDYYYLLRRANTGWVSVPVPSQIPGTYYTAFTFDSSNTLFAALEEYSYTTGRSLGRGIYYTINQGASWTFAGLDSMNVNQIVSYGSSTYAVTDRGIYIVNKNGAMAVKVQNQIPLKYELFQNYPNPFNPATVLSFVISHSSFIKLKVYDVLGNEIKTLVNEYKPAGKYTISFDASKLASGIYFYVLKAGNNMIAKKMILLK